MLVPPARLRTWHGLREVARHWRRSSSDLRIRNERGIATYRIPWWGVTASVAVRARARPAISGFDQYRADHGRPDIIHAHGTLYGGLCAAVIKKQRSLPVVLTEHSSSLVGGTFLWPDQVGVIRKTLGSIDRAIAVGPRLADALMSFGRMDRPDIIGNCVNPDFFKLGDLQLSREPFVFLVVGNLTRRKGVHLILKAFAEACRGGPYRLRVVGVGPHKAQLLRLGERLAVAHQVDFLGKQTRRGVRDWIQRSHVLLSASDVETFGITVIESLACGRPVITTRSGGPDWHVDQSVGVLVPTGNPRALANAMRKIIHSYDNYDPIGIRNRCIAQFGEAAIVAQLETIYRRLI